MNTAQHIARDASFQAFANCYLREVDAGVWHSVSSWQASTGVRLSRAETHVVELDVPSQAQLLALGVSYRSTVGRHVLTDVYRRRHSQRDWQRVDSVSTLLVLIDAIYARRPECDERLELIARVVESQQTMALYLEHHLARLEGIPLGDAHVDAGFIASEQSVALGHWLHPIPKSRQGMSPWQHEHYAPETGGRFQLHFFAARRSLVLQASLLTESAEAISRRIALRGPHAEPNERCERALAQLGPGFCLLPSHPLQAEWLKHQEHVRTLLASGDLVDLGRLGPEFTATSSVRTVYAESLDVMVKLAIPVKITNSLRINLQSELGDSVWISKLMHEYDLRAEFPGLRTIEDPAYISLGLADREETGFEVIFRSNPFGVAPGDAPRTVHSIAALVQDPVREGDRSALCALVHRVAEREQLSLPDAGRRWFDAYWRCAVETPIRIYDRHGMALEAHQQNALLEFGPTGMPTHSYCRDIQGLALSESFRERSIELVPELEAQHKVFEDDAIVRQGIGYYLFFNQVIAVMHRFGVDGLLSEDELVGVVQKKLRALRADVGQLGVALIDGLLESETIPFKGNLLTRVADMDELQSEDELAVYLRIPNPLHVTRAGRVMTSPPSVSANPSNH